MTSLLWRTHRRVLARYPGQVALTLLGIALGVAMVVAIDLANASAQRAFILATDSIVGKATHWIIGGPNGLPEALYVDLRLRHGLRSSAPIVEGNVYLDEREKVPLRLIGLDPFAEQPFRDYLSTWEDGGAEGDIAALLSEPRTLILEQASAQRLGLTTGDQFLIRVGTERIPVTLVGTFKTHDALTQEGLADVLIADIATAQELLQQFGKLSRIDLIIPPESADPNAETRLSRLLPAGIELVTANTRNQAVAEMTRAFQLNLTALSLLALLVGSFIVYNTATFLWLQRRRLIGLLRALGVTRAQIGQILLMEAMVLGALGASSGVLLGIGLGNSLVGLVSQTFNDLYFAVQIRHLPLSAVTLSKGIALGLGATLIATLLPAWEATRVPPGIALRRTPLEAQARRWLRGAAVLGASTLATGGGILLLPSKSILLGFVGLTGVQVGCAMLSPMLGTLLLRFAGPFLRRGFGIFGQLASRSIVASLSRTGIAMAALSLAVAATVGIGVMIDSFRLSVSQWLTITLQADLYVSIPGTQANPSRSTLPESLRKRIAATPGVAAVSTSRWIRLEGSDGFTNIIALQPAPQSKAGFQFTAGNPEKAWQAFSQEEAVLISEPYAYHHNLAPGAPLTLRTDRGEQTFSVAGVYRNYSSDRGVITLHRRTYDCYWADRGFSNISVYAKPGVDLEQLRQTLLQQSEQEIQITTHRALRELSLEIFDRTFTITQVVRLLAGLVAFAGIFSALMALQLERSKELGILRAIGFLPRQVRQLIIAQTGLMGLVCGLVALPMGILSAVGLVYVINRRSFGWSMEFFISPTILFQGLLLALAAALLAGLYPAWRMARTPPAEGLREE